VETSSEETNHLDRPGHHLRRPNRRTRQPRRPRLAPTADQAQTAYLSAQILGRYHYKSVPLDDAMSEKIFDRYLKALDPNACSSPRPTSTASPTPARASTTRS
jgi:hypothetical protein